MNEVLGRSQPTCLPGTSLLSSLPQGPMQGTGSTGALAVNGVKGSGHDTLIAFERGQRSEKPSLTSSRTNQPLCSTCSITTGHFLPPLSAILLSSCQPSHLTQLVFVSAVYQEKWESGHLLLKHSLCGRGGGNQTSIK